MTRRSALFLAVLGSAAAGQTSSSSSKSRGIPMASLTIEVFSDFQCPACKSLHDQTLQPLITDYVDKGKVYIMYRDFPLPIHAYARQASGYACAAARIGRYEQVANALFADQPTWSQNGNIDPTLNRVLNPAEFKKVKALAKSSDVLAEIERDVQKGRAANIQQTPTMILTRKSKTYPVAGVVSYSILRRFVDQLLAQ